MSKFKGLNVLVFDIETAPILGYVWGLWDNNLGLEQIRQDWHLLSWSAKWLKNDSGEVLGPHDKVMYMDQRNATNMEDDSKILKGIWQLLDAAHIVITQNGKTFDQKKLNARFILNGFQPPSSYKHIDTLQIAKKHFGFTSNKLAYMSDKLCKKYKKLSHPEFSGFQLWKECLAGNLKAWREMEKYNKHDVLALEELYSRLIPWDNSINFNVYTDNGTAHCRCGSSELSRNGFNYTPSGKYQRYKCSKCGSETRDRRNLLSKDKRASLKTDTTK